MSKAWQVYAICGCGIWLGLMGFAQRGDDELSILHQLLWFALLVVTPLALSLDASRTLHQDRLFRVLAFAYPPAVLLTLPAFFMTHGFGAAALAATWLGFTLLVALQGLLGFWTQRFTSIADLCIHTAMVYLPVGGVWLVFARFGAQPLGFGDVIVALTAVHFHYAGFAVLVIAGLIGRRLPIRAHTTHLLFRMTASGLIIGMALVASGITLSAILNSLLLEVIAVLFFVLSVLSLAYLILAHIAPSTSSLVVRALFAIAGLSPCVTMLLAAAYTLGRFTQLWRLSIPEMITWHGWINALGFVGCGLIACALSQADEKA